MQTEALKPATTYPAIVGGVLAQIRNQNGLRQEELAQALRITQATLSRIEKGQSGITVEHLRLAAQKLGSTPAVILAYADQAEVNMQIQGITVTPTRDDDSVNSPPPKGGGFGLRLKAGFSRPQGPTRYTTLK
jgi:transcriptional regulator with XRE-family HTH domain